MKHLTLTRKIALTLLVLLTTTTLAVAQGQLPASGTGAQDNPYLIQTKADWDNLAEYVAAGNDCNGLYFQMTANIGTTADPITRPIGQQTSKNKTDRKRFKGTFDGGNHTLTIALNTSSSYWSFNKGYCSPFAYTWDATIKNLHVVGSVTTTGCWASGLVGSTGDNFVGTCHIDNCQISVEITANYISTGGAYGNHGGIIGIAEGVATITNTWFDGKFLGKDYQYSGGFIGMNKGQGTVVNNCLFNPSEINIENNNVTGSFEFVHNTNNGTHTLTNAYWVKHFGEIENAQGQRVSADEPDPLEYSYNTIEAVDGNNYYIVLKSVTWGNIEKAIASPEAGFFNLASDVVAGTEDVALVIPGGKTFELRMNGHTIDRGFQLSLVQVNGYVIKVETGGTLTINGGTITGGNNGLHDDQTNTLYNAGGIYNAGTLNLNGTTITGNSCKGNGAGIYNTGTLNINNATITGNNGRQKKNMGGGVYVASSATMNIVGNVQIHDNKSVWTNGTQQQEPQDVYLANSTLINITGSITDSNMNVTMETPGVFTNYLAGNGNISIFASDQDGYAVMLNGSGEAQLVPCSISVTGYGSGTGKWVFIASPQIEDVAPTGVTNLISSTVANYDLYRFNQSAAKEWENYKNTVHHDAFVLENGKGYLYANKNTTLLKFSGALNTNTSKEVDLDYDENANLAGYNLVGNPFPVVAYVDKPYYKMNAEGTNIEATSTSTTTSIPVCTGVIVQANGTGDKVTFSTEDPSKAYNDNGSIQMSLVKSGSRGESEMQDNAIVSFNKGEQLGKYIFNKDNAKIYIPQNGKDYAIVSAERKGEMPVNFEAKEMGMYTINISGDDLDGVCLVDKIEGAVIDLSVNTSYSFIGSANDRNDRFKLVFDAKASDFENAHFAYQNGSEIVVNGEGELQVFDVMGRMVSNAIVNGVETIALPQGVYIFRLNENIQKIVVR